MLRQALLRNEWHVVRSICLKHLEWTGSISQDSLTVTNAIAKEHKMLKLIVQCQGSCS